VGHNALSSHNIANVSVNVLLRTFLYRIWYLLFAPS